MLENSKLNVLKARLTANLGRRSISNLISAEPHMTNKYMARFSSVQGGEVRNYEGKIDWDKGEVGTVELKLNQKKYFAFSIDDVDALLTDPERVESEARRQANLISAEEDTFLLDALKKDAGNTIQRTIKTPEQAYDALVDANRTLNKEGVAQMDRFFIIDYDILGMLEKDNRFTHKYEILENGLVEGARVNGVPIVVTNYLPEDSFLVVQKEGVAFARFLDKLETMRLETAFADGIRGITVFDGKPLAEKHIVAVNVVRDEPATRVAKPKEDEKEK